jgi:hypothetical protein
MAKPKLRDLSRIQPEFQEAMDVTNALGKEVHPIATAVLGAVMVEHELETLLRSKFQRKDDKTWEMLVADNGPLNSFYSKIIAGYALGIYDEGMRNDLNIVRNIRNAFAHSKRLLHFDNPLIVKELEKATRSYVSKEYWNLAKVEPPPGAAEFSSRYVALCNWLAAKLVRIRSLRQDKSKRYPHQRRAISPLAFAALLPPPGGKDK